MLDRWFLTPDERGNPATELDRRRGDGRAYTGGNAVEVLVDGADYFRRLHAQLCALEAGDRLLFTDWRGDHDERLLGNGTDIGHVLAELASRRVDVRGLVWRSHSDKTHFSEEENRELAEIVNEAGGEVLLDERVRRFGSHHQKMFVVHRHRTSDDDVAFIGGIDLSHGRHDDHRHLGDEQAIELNPRYGPRPPWHDVQLQVQGPAVGDVAYTFRERWDDPLRLDHRSPWRTRLARVAREPRRPHPLPTMPDPTNVAGTHAVQVLRTYPAKRPPYPFAPEGERSIARAYLKAFRRARALIYIEDQYLWSAEAANAVASALREAPNLHLVVVVPRYPDRDSRLTGPPYRIAQQHSIAVVRAAGGERVVAFDLEAESGSPIYVHAKVCIIDDVWMAVGSDNLNRRSWTNDSEASCAVIDETLDEREPVDPGGLGDGARRLARDTRLRLWREHLGGRADDGDLIDPVAGVANLRRHAIALDAWNDGGRQGQRPPGRLRLHRAEPVGPLSQLWARPVYRQLVDPDGRPRALRRSREF